MSSPGNNKTIVSAVLLITLHLLTCDSGAAVGQVAPGGEPRQEVEQAAQPAAGGHAPGKGRTIKDRLVVGFTINGNDPWKKKTVGDLEVIVTDADQRYLPLLRLLKVFEIEPTTQGDTVKFLPEGMPYVTLNTALGTIEVDHATKSIEIVRAKSDTTGEPDLFVAAAAISGILGIELSWNESNYEFVGRTERTLKIFKTSRRSAHEIQVQDVPANLPEAHPQALPNRTGLDYMELTLRANLFLDNNLKDRQWGLDFLQQNFWGSFLGGAFRLRFSEPELLFNSKERRSADSSPLMLSAGEWRNRFPSAELSVGDTSFGLSDLSFPCVRMTGVRLNGLAGFSAEENPRDRSSLGLRSYFVQPQLFAGSAPRGSQVELRINGRVVDTQEAVPAIDSEVGMGVYRFEDIQLAPGSLSEILITITENNGNKSYRKQEILGTSLFLPAGKLAYLGGVGTSRDVGDWHTRGVFAGGRALYALSDHFTLGYTLAFQESLFSPAGSQLLGSRQRRFPGSSQHMGGQFVWQPSNYLILNGDLALSNGREARSQASYHDLAFKTQASLFPTSGSSILGQYFRYGPDFFNGQNVELRDRQGYALTGKWRLSPEWSMSGLYAKVSNNLDRSGPETLDLEFQNLEITSTALPRATASLSVNRTVPNWEAANTLYLLKVYAIVAPDVTVSAAVASGDSLYLSDHADFANGINMAGLAADDLASFVNVGVMANDSNYLGASYAKSGSQKELLATHRYRSGDNSFRYKMDIGYDFGSRTPVVKNRSEYLLDAFGEKSLELVTGYEDKNLSAVLSFNYRGLFGFPGRLPAQVQSRFLQPDSGGVGGKVYLDYNANAQLDPDEPGLENVQVTMGGNHSLTDKNGYFKLPNNGEISDVRVFMDMNTVPAIYSPTHGLQKAHIVPGILTEVNLGVTPLISVSGLVTAETNEHGIKPLYGVRVFATRPNDSKVLAESSTARDGSYYLGDLRPGRYLLQVDREFLQQNIEADNVSQAVEIAPAKEPQEINAPSFKFFYKKDNGVAPTGKGDRPTAVNAAG